MKLFQVADRYCKESRWKTLAAYLPLKEKLFRTWQAEEQEKTV